MQGQALDKRDFQKLGSKEKIRPNYSRKAI